MLDPVQDTVAAGGRASGQCCALVAALQGAILVGSSNKSPVGLAEGEAKCYRPESLGDFWAPLWVGSWCPAVGRSGYHHPLEGDKITCIPSCRKVLKCSNQQSVVSYWKTKMYFQANPGTQLNEAIFQRIKEGLRTESRMRRACLLLVNAFTSSNSRWLARAEVNLALVSTWSHETGFLALL